MVSPPCWHKKDPHYIPGATKHSKGMKEIKGDWLP